MQSKDKSKTQDHSVASTNSVGCVFIKDLMTLDCGVYDLKAGIFGATWHVDLTITGALDHRGFVYDFSPLKKLVKNILKDHLDHALLVPGLADGVELSAQTDGERLKLGRTANRSLPEANGYEYIAPKGSVFKLQTAEVTSQNVAKAAIEILKEELPKSICDVGIELREESWEQGRFGFRYTHGLPLHEGLCQRTFHGHRSLIEVFEDHIRRPDLEKYIAETLFQKSVHIASENQIEDPTLLSKVKNHRFGLTKADDGGLEMVTLAYSGSFGEFRAKIPANQLYIIAGETSIESITAHLRDRLIKDLGQTIKGELKVICFEGVGKGSVALASGAK